MKFNLIVFLFLLQCSSICFSQDTQEFEEIVEEYYSNLQVAYEKESAAYSLEFHEKNGHFPFPQDVIAYQREFYKKEREKYFQTIKNKSSCVEMAIEYTEKMLKIIEFGKNRARQDTAIAVLIDELYEINSEEAIRFSLERFGYFNVLDLDRNRIDDPYNIKEYPYINSLYTKMPISRFIGLMLESDIKNEGLINLCIDRFTKDFSASELEELKIYAESFIKVNKIKKINNYFLAKLKAI